MIDRLASDDTLRTDFLKACLAKLGLRVNRESSTVPSLSEIHLSASEPGAIPELVSSLREIITVEDGEEYIKDESDTFRLEKPSSFRMSKMVEALPDSSKETTDQPAEDDDRVVDYNAILKRMVVHDEFPGSKETPSFNHHAFYANLKEYASQSKDTLQGFGSHILYGEVVTSTNTILEK